MIWMRFVDQRERFELDGSSHNGKQATLFIHRSFPLRMADLSMMWIPFQDVEFGICHGMYRSIQGGITRYGL